VRAALLLALLAAGAAGCRPDPGASKYDEQEHFMGGDARLPGPNPYHAGDSRLSVGAFYEMDASDTIAIDNVTTHVYVYTDTLGLQDDPDHIEGLSATRITHLGKAWGGFGVNWDAEHDLSAWTKMHVSFKSADPTFMVVDISMLNVSPVLLHANDYGWAADGAWHNLVIPLADFVAKGLDLSAVKAPFVFGCGPGAGGELVVLDDLYFTAD
jgi:hypothetical protein